MNRRINALRDDPAIIRDKLPEFGSARAAGLPKSVQESRRAHAESVRRGFQPNNSMKSPYRDSADHFMLNHNSCSD